jgi:hypothetical protein
MAHHEQYMLHVTAGATYDTSKHEDVLVNTEKPVDISSDLIDARIHMRIKDYRGTLLSLGPSSSYPSHATVTNTVQAYPKAPQRHRPISQHRNIPTTATRYPSPSHPNKTSPATSSSSETTLTTRSATDYHPYSIKRLA